MIVFFSRLILNVMRHDVDPSFVVQVDTITYITSCKHCGSVKKRSAM